MSRERVKTIKPPLILPENLVREIDRLMGKRKRSRFVTEAAQKELKRIRLERVLEKAAGAWKGEDHPELQQKGTYQWVRGLRKEAERRFERITK